jgi:DNA primase
MLLYQTEVITILNKALNQTARIRKGVDAVYFCPSCKHYKRKLEVNTLTGKYHCWVCGLSGSSLKTLFKKLGLSSELASQIYNNTQSLKKLPTQDLDLVVQLFNVGVQEQKPQLFLPNEYKSFYNADISLTGKHALNYLKSRNISKYDILRYNIGYCDDGKYKDRVIIPSYDSNGQLNFFSTRSIYDNVSMKYINSMVSKDIIGFELFLNYDLPLTLVEGSFDAIAVRNNAIPLFGKTLSMKLKTSLVINNVKSVNVVLDNDAIKDSIRICDFLVKNNIKTKLIQLDGKDPSVLGFSKTWEIINKTPVLDFEYLSKIKLSI